MHEHGKARCHPAIVVGLHLPEAAAQRRNDHFDGNYWLPGQHWYWRLQKDRYGSVRGASSFIFTTRSNGFALRRSLKQDKEVDKESLLHGRSLARQALLLDIYCKPDSANIGKWRQGLQNWDARYIMQEFAWKLNWIHFIQPRMVKISMEGGGHQRLLPWRRIFSVNESSGLGAPAKGEGSEFNGLSGINLVGCTLDAEDWVYSSEQGILQEIYREVRSVRESLRCPLNCEPKYGTSGRVAPELRHDAPELKEEKSQGGKNFGEEINVLAQIQY
ncbi:hypothetical protein FB451DRAFT_1171559 [Mycena latifolia]|nr:hypothetical protein FB451DRAFT_1171559 [Mycena latifolia]